MSKKVVIVGGVAGGATAAARLRRLDENIEIVMFEKGEYISFANCGLPYYIGNVIKDRQKLLVQTEEAMEARFNIDIRPMSEVIKIDKEKKEVEVLSAGQKYFESYDNLILSPGAYPFVPNVDGVEKDGVFTLWNMKDVDRIKSFVKDKEPKRAVVIGGGFVGVEVAENLKNAGVNTVLVEAAEQIMAPLDVEMARIIEKHIVDNGIPLILGDGLVKIEGIQNMNVVLKSDRKIPADIVIIAIGVKPDVKLASQAGLELGARGGIRVDDNMRTSDSSIYAVGDAIEVKDFVNDNYTLIPLAGPANKQGRIAADNICGKNTKFNGSQGTSIIKIFDLTAAATGNNEKTLKRMGISYQKSYTHSSSHAGYYPGAFPMTIKLLFNPENGMLLGAQVVGRDGVDKRIDVLAQAIRHKLSVYDLEELELAYAPPYSSAKDPVNMAGFTAGNILRGDMKVIHWDEIDSLNKDKDFILDVRTEMEYTAGKIKDAVNIPVDSLRSRLAEIPKNKRIIIYCKIGLRGYIAYRILSQNGFDARNLSGGYDIYMAANYKYGEGIDLNDQMTEIEKKEEPHRETKTIKIDACGLQCPGPIMRVYKEIENINNGDILEVHVTDPAFSSDIKAWCGRTGNTLIGVDKTCCDYVGYIMKGTNKNKDEIKNIDSKDITNMLPQGKTMVVFSADLDKAIASFVIANGAAAMGRHVTMFFTFWGLNILRKDNYVKVKKSFIEKMFGRMMPRGSKKLKLSNMNMVGIGAKMIRGIMKSKNILSLEELMEQAKQNGVKFIACSMSMDVMGIKEEELIDGVDIGGVAAYLGEAEQSNVNLFI